MSENPIAISNLNDFIFCPVSIYFHLLEGDEETLLYQDSQQLNGTHSHRNSDSARYSSKKNILQGVGVYCSKYNLIGKIDTFDADNGILTERKKKIKTIYDGYVFQLYAQYFSLSEMGYQVNKLQFYSMDDNKVYVVDRPEDSPEMFSKFEMLIDEMASFSPENFKQENSSKCENCIYEQLCTFSGIKE